MATQKAIELSYENVKNLVHDTVWKFHSRYKGDIHELQAQGVEHFFEAYYSYNPDKSAFTTWVRKIVWLRLLDQKRKEMKFHNALKRAHMDIESIHTRFYCPDIQKLVSSLGDDASVAVEVALNPNYEMKRTIIAKGKSAYVMRRVVKEELKRKGWTYCVRVIFSRLL